MHLRNEVFIVPVHWAHATYHYVRTNAIGDALGWFLFALLAIPYLHIVRRFFSGDRSSGPLAAGFTIYIACGMVEVLVANGEVVWLSPADLGFLAVIVPTSVRVLQQFIRDARDLDALSGQLAGEVRDRTFERDRAETALLESERLAALGRLAAGVGHEINNPLTYLQLALDRVHGHLDHTSPPPDVRRALEDARDGAWRIQKVVRACAPTLAGTRSVNRSTCARWRATRSRWRSRMCGTSPCSRPTWSRRHSSWARSRDSCRRW